MKVVQKVIIINFSLICSSNHGLASVKPAHHCMDKFKYEMGYNTTCTCVQHLLSCCIICYAYNHLGMPLDVKYDELPCKNNKY